jgi:hypothetical protein
MSAVNAPTSPRRLDSARLRRASRERRERAGALGGEPFWRVRKPTRGIRSSASAALNRLKQAAPENDPAYCIHPGLLLAKTVDSCLVDELRRPWVIRGSRLFNTCFGCNRAVRKVARSLCHAPKRLPSKRPARSRLARRSLAESKRRGEVGRCRRCRRSS